MRILNYRVRYQGGLTIPICLA